MSYTNSTVTTTALVPYYPEHETAQIAKKYLQNKRLKESLLSAPLTIFLSGDLSDLYEKALIPFLRLIERQYQELPWPERMRKIAVETQVVGGKGDIAAAAKAISLMQRICPKTLSFDWVSQHPRDWEPLSFLSPAEASTVTNRRFNSTPLDPDGVDFLLVGPVASFGKGYIEDVIGRKIAGAMYGFKEVAQGTADPREMNFELYRNIFPSHSESRCFSMGIIPGSGVFLDQSRLQAPLSRIYCCPTYLHSIQEEGLRKDILESMQVYNDSITANFDKFSLNSGYAHSPDSWGQFIDSIALHEKDKHVVIVLNQKGEFINLSAEEFCHRIFTPERLNLLQKKGYGSLTLKGQNTQIAVLLSEEGQDHRNMTVIIRPSFKPNDLKQLQLASERLLATGDNTAVESWCARCKLYQYECLPHKSGFKRQQIELAQVIAPSLATFLGFRGNIEKLEEVLSDPSLEKDTLKFCRYITEHCSFDPIFEAAIKRTAWHHIIPELRTLEESIINKNKEFQKNLMEYIDDPRPGKSLSISNGLPLKQRVHERVEQYIGKTRV